MNNKSEDKITKYANRIDTRVALLEQPIIHFNDSLNRIESALYEIKFDINELRREMKNYFLFTITAIAGAILAVVMAHGFRWF